ncbi:hypothetical protein GCM10027596_16210 [Nocardioides korecus]
MSQGPATPVVGDPSAFSRPPAPERPRRWRGVRDPLLVGGTVTALTLALHLRDPHTSGSWGGCPWLALTGMYCPGCGGLRAVNDLTDGHVVAALSSNLVFVLSVPFLLVWWVRWVRRAWTGAPAPVVSARTRTVVIAGAVLVTVVFTVLRNTPAGAWLAP